MSDRVAILERALRWYADPKNWRADDWGVSAVIAPPDYGDPGKKARNALKRAARANEEETPVAINAKTVISAVWNLHGGRGEWPTVAAIAKHLEVDEKAVRPLLGELKASCIFRDRRRRGETVWGPWDAAEFER